MKTMTTLKDMYLVSVDECCKFTCQEVIDYISWALSSRDYFTPFVQHTSAPQEGQILLLILRTL